MASPDIRSGARLGEQGRYQLESVLGTGGMASVWRATDRRLDRPVAVKILSDVLALDHSYVRRFAREARVAAAMSHPNLVSIYDVSPDDVRPFLVLELITGGTLADRLRTPRDSGWNPTSVGRELLEAVAYMHRVGVLHRDIKPANILIDSNGHARLTDFGIAQPSDATHMTRTGDVIGTRRYIAPELLTGSPATEQSDLYACGVVLGECFTADAQSPFSGVIGELTRARPTQRPVSATAALARYDAAAEATEPTAVNRPRRTVADRPLRTAVTRIAPRRQGRRPLSSAPTSQVRLAAHRGPTRPQVIAAAVITTAVLLLVLLVSLTGSRRTNPPEPVTSTTGTPLVEQLTVIDRTIAGAHR